MDLDKIIKEVDPNRDYTVDETAKLLGVSYSATLAHVNRKTFPTRRIFNRIFIKGKDIRNYLTRG